MFWSRDKKIIDTFWLKNIDTVWLRKKSAFLVEKSTYPTPWKAKDLGTRKTDWTIRMCRLIVSFHLSHISVFSCVTVHICELI